MAISISIDAMGGDKGPLPVLLASLHALSEYKDLSLHVVGNEHILREMMQEHRIPSHERLSIHHAEDVIDMNEDPFTAIGRTQSSMYMALNLLKKKTSNACISCGNTGALVSMSYRLLHLFKGITRPAIMGKLPSANHRKCVHMLDIGANISCDSNQLVQFAIMGNTYIQRMYHIDRPKVALLNIGKEKNKGTKSVREADVVLSSIKEINYIGFIEGNVLLTEEVDLIVTDGVTGNVAIKAMEGSYNFFLYKIKNNAFCRILFYLLRPLLHLMSKNDPSNYNGAHLIGINGIVVKSHGASSESSFLQAIKHAVEVTQQNTLQHMRQQVSFFCESKL